MILVSISLLTWVWEVKPGGIINTLAHITNFCFVTLTECITGRNSDFNWPAYSPDLNPCDFYLWGFLKSRVYSDPYPQTLEQLKVNIKREMKKISKDTIESVVNNFSARTRHVLSKRGAWFEQIINY